MAQFVAFDPIVEVNGETVLSVLAGMEQFKEDAIQLLKENGINNPKPGQWFPQQAWLNAFKLISEKIGPFTLFLIGKKIPDNAQWPPFVNSVETALSSIDIAYHMNHRKNGVPLFDPKTGKMEEGIGHYAFEKVDERSAKVVCKNPYPCDFDKGIIESAARKFKPEDSAFIIVKHLDPEMCRKTGGDSCAYSVKW